MTTEAPITAEEAERLGLNDPVPESRALKAAFDIVPENLVRAPVLDRPPVETRRLFTYDIDCYLPWRGIAVRIVLDVESLSATGRFFDDDGRPAGSFVPPPDLVAAAIMAAGPEAMERGRIQLGGRIAGAVF